MSNFAQLKAIMEQEKSENKLAIGVRKAFLVPVFFYRRCISPLFPPVCRFTPTCSQYCVEAVMKHGVFKGFYLAFRRILRCRPGGGHGYDPVP